MTSRLYSFAGGAQGTWRVLSNKVLVGEPLRDVERLDVFTGDVDGHRAPHSWALRGIKSNDRYVTRSEKTALLSKQQVLGRPEAVCAALIPIRKTNAWWALTQDERRQIFEESSNHIAIGLKYLPAIARSLHYCRDLGDDEPFDFLTWFEYAPQDAATFESLVAELRRTPEWGYVDREIDLRLRRDQ